MNYPIKEWFKNEEYDKIMQLNDIQRLLERMESEYKSKYKTDTKYEALDYATRALHSLLKSYKVYDDGQVEDDKLLGHFINYALDYKMLRMQTMYSREVKPSSISIEANKDYFENVHGVYQNNDFVDDIIHKITFDKKYSFLSDKEMYVFKGLGNGATQEQLADELNISQPRINQIKNRIKEKIEENLNFSL